MSGKLKNKVSIITGAGSGIGKSIAKEFANENSKVYLLDVIEDSGLEAKEEIIQNGGIAQFIYCDVSIEESVKNAVRKVLDEQEQIDIIVNNAAISHVGNIEQTSLSDLDRLYNVNIKSVYFVTKETIGSMVSTGGGVILNLASIQQTK